jgi:hypothetical protein
MIINLKIKTIKWILCSIWRFYKFKNQDGIGCTIEHQLQSIDQEDFDRDGIDWNAYTSNEDCILLNRTWWKSFKV